VSDVIASEDRIHDIDLNPVIGAGAVLVAVDALVIVGTRPDDAEGRTP
jgi:hypothetical protein